jgi:hypothetical protein
MLCCAMFQSMFQPSFEEIASAPLIASRLPPVIKHASPPLVLYTGGVVVGIYVHLLVQMVVFLSAGSLKDLWQGASCWACLMIFLPVHLGSREKVAQFGCKMMYNNGFTVHLTSPPILYVCMIVCFVGMDCKTCCMYSSGGLVI